MSDVLPGAEPWLGEGGPDGVLVLHGFTGTPQSMRGLAEAFAAAGHAVALPLLPGHGTSVEDMLTTSWADWSAAAETAYDELAARCRRVAVAGLSMGGSLTVWLAGRRPDVAALVCINAAVQSDETMTGFIQGLVDAGETLMPGVGGDIADPEATELAYDQVPLEPLLSMFAAASEIEAAMTAVTCPVLVVASTEDHVVPPANSDHLAAAVSGPVQRLRLERSFHVATLDHERELIERTAVDFVGRALGGD